MVCNWDEPHSIVLSLPLWCVYMRLFVLSPVDLLCVCMCIAIAFSPVDLLRVLVLSIVRS